MGVASEASCRVESYPVDGQRFPGGSVSPGAAGAVHSGTAEPMFARSQPQRLLSLVPARPALCAVLCRGQCEWDLRCWGSILVWDRVF